MYFSSNLAYLRKKNNLTQEALAKEFFVAPSTFTNYETSIREPSLERVVALARYFNVSTDDLLTKDLRPAGTILSSNIKYLRKREHYTQQEIAKILRVTPKCISFYELGERKPTIEGLLYLSEFFGITVDQLLKEDLSKGGS